MENVKRIQAKAKKKFDVKSAGERLLWRLQPGAKSFTPNDKDYNALVTVLEWINRQENVNVKGHVLYAKLYIYFLTQGIRHHKTTVFNPEVAKELHRILSTPFPLFYKAFITDLYNNQLNRINAEGIEVFDETMKDLEQFKQTFTEDYIKGKLNEMISESLNRFS